MGLSKRSAKGKVHSNTRLPQKTKIMASSSITSWQKTGKQWKQWLTLFWGAPKSLQMVIAAMKLKDDYTLKGKLRPT